MKLTAPFLFAAALLLPCATSCQGPAAQFETASALDVYASVPGPDPDKVAIGEMSIRINSKLVDDETKRELSRAIASQAGGLRTWTTRDKAPEYRVVIHQVNSADEWNASGAGALFGAVGGGLLANEMSGDRGSSILGAGAGAAAGAIGFSSQEGRYFFKVSVYRRTTEGAVRERVASLDGQELGFLGGVSGSTTSSVNASSSTNSTVEMDFEKDEYPSYLAAVLTVRAHGLHGDDSMEDAARRELVRALPGMLFGGDEIVF